MNRLTLIFPQWQGGTALDTYQGAMEVKDFYLGGEDYMEIPVRTAPDSLEKKHNVIGFEAIQEQMKQAARILREKNPQTLFTVGGGCDADIPSIAYLNEKLGGDLTLVWLDAHGDLNSPEESKSGRFYGMPARILTGVSPLFSEHVPLPVKPEQLIHVGGRAFDKAETRYMDAAGIVKLSVDEYVSDPQKLIEAVRVKGSRNVYVHLDLDVLEPREFSHMPLRVPGGLPTKKVLGILEDLKRHFHLAGLGLYEYIPAKERNPFMEELMQRALTK